MGRLLASAIAMLLASMFVVNVYASDCPNGELVIIPHGSYYPLPIMLSSPATFTIESGNTTIGLFPYIVLVMTKASYDGLTAPVRVNWTGTSGQYNETIFPKTSFSATTTGYIPDTTVTPFDTGRYAVSNLKEHLGVNGTQNDVLYYTFGPFFGGTAIGRIPRQFTVTLPSTKPRMLVLAIARSGVCAAFFNMRVPPCRPGFIVPETPPIFIALASFAAIGLYAVKRKKQ
jgi:hypothetical protein